MSSETTVKNISPFDKNKHTGFGKIKADTVAAAIDETTDTTGYTSEEIAYAQQLKGQYGTKFSDDFYLQYAHRAISGRLAGKYANTITDINAAPDPAYAQYSYEEILAMVNNGVKVPKDVIAWAKAHQEADVTDYVVVDDTSETADSNPDNNNSEESEINKIRNQTKDYIKKATKAQSDLETNNSKMQDLATDASDMQKKQKDLFKNSSLDKAEAMSKEWNALDEKQQKGELKGYEKTRYKQLSKQLNANNDTIRELKITSQNLDKFLSSIDDLQIKTKDSLEIANDTLDASSRLSKLNKTISSVHTTHTYETVASSSQGMLDSILAGMSNDQISYVADRAGRDLESAGNAAKADIQSDEKQELVTFADDYVARSNEVAKTSKNIEERENPETKGVSDFEDDNKDVKGEETDDNNENKETVNNEIQNDKPVNRAKAAPARRNSAPAKTTSAETTSAPADLISAPETDEQQTGNAVDIRNIIPPETKFDKRNPKTTATAQNRETPETNDETSRRTVAAGEQPQSARLPQTRTANFNNDVSANDDTQNTDKTQKTNNNKTDNTNNNGLNNSKKQNDLKSEYGSNTDYKALLGAGTVAVLATAMAGMNPSPFIARVLLNVAVAGTSVADLYDKKDTVDKGGDIADKSTQESNKAVKALTKKDGQDKAQAQAKAQAAQTTSTSKEKLTNAEKVNKSSDKSVDEFSDVNDKLTERNENNNSVGTFIVDESKISMEIITSFITLLSSNPFTMGMVGAWFVALANNILAGAAGVGAQMASNNVSNGIAKNEDQAKTDNASLKSDSKTLAKIKKAVAKAESDAQKAQASSQPENITEENAQQSDGTQDVNQTANNEENGANANINANTAETNEELQNNAKLFANGLTNTPEGQNEYDLRPQSEVNSQNNAFAANMPDNKSSDEVKISLSSLGKPQINENANVKVSNKNNAKQNVLKDAYGTNEDYTKMLAANTAISLAAATDPLLFISLAKANGVTVAASVADLYIKNAVVSKSKNLADQAVKGSEDAAKVLKNKAAQVKTEHDNNMLQAQTLTGKYKDLNDDSTNKMFQTAQNQQTLAESGEAAVDTTSAAADPNASGKAAIQSSLSGLQNNDSQLLSSINSPLTKADKTTDNSRKSVSSLNGLNDNLDNRNDDNEKLGKYIVAEAITWDAVMTASLALCAAGGFFSMGLVKLWLLAIAEGAAVGASGAGALVASNDVKGNVNDNKEAVSNGQKSLNDENKVFLDARKTMSKLAQESVKSVTDVEVAPQVAAANTQTPNAQAGSENASDREAVQAYNSSEDSTPIANARKSSDTINAFDNSSFDAALDKNNPNDVKFANDYIQQFTQNMRAFDEKTGVAAVGANSNVNSNYDMNTKSETKLARFNKDGAIESKKLSTKVNEAYLARNKKKRK